MSEWISNGYEVSNDCDALLYVETKDKDRDMLPWWHFTTLSISHALCEFSISSE